MKGYESGKCYLLCQKMRDCPQILQQKRKDSPQTIMCCHSISEWWHIWHLLYSGNRWKKDIHIVAHLLKLSIVSVSFCIIHHISSSQKSNHRHLLSIKTREKKNDSTRRLLTVTEYRFQWSLI